MQCQLFSVLHTDVAVSLCNIVNHSFRIRLDHDVDLRAACVEDALLAKFGARLQENLLDLHYITFKASELNLIRTCEVCRKSKSAFKMLRKLL